MKQDNVVTTYSAPAAHAAAQVLRYLSTQSEPSGLAEIAAATAVSKSLAFRVIHELERNGLVVRDSATRYALGLGLLELSAAALTTTSPVSLCAAVLQQLADQVGGTANLGYLRDQSVMYLMKREGAASTVTISHVGSRLPANCSALGRALLSTLPDETTVAFVQGELPSLTPHSVVDPHVLLAQVRSTREQGYFVERSESVIGRACVAAPLTLSLAGDTYAISVSFSETLLEDGRDEIIHHVTEAAELLSRRMRAWQSVAASHDNPFVH